MVVCTNNECLYCSVLLVGTLNPLLLWQAERSIMLVELKSEYDLARIVLWEKESKKYKTLLSIKNNRYLYLYGYTADPKSGKFAAGLSLSLLVFYVTCNDISVIYVTAQMCRQTEEEVVPTVGLQTP